ncbi:putative zinc-type alcohol dehydrogenase-like protein YjmD [Caloramator mitchellensis]|uniref:Putative zinc-type alcohol dehydrogenase-like protein YjmD n=1 Tax=Caloramator mitchellensis TaxID=908809 RepID=A0A0R3K2H8_CALMK|nr:zinc-binding dehydrogenase [Caloramator mitchellensis]KRQ87620.1 putative zinc-type alcohol dehydrogenase-like protein YjmD [Caloramator mitchellensis]
MGVMLNFVGPREVGFEEYDERKLNQNEIRLKTLYSGISAGTELTAYRGSNPYLSKKWNADLRIFENTETTTYSYPLKAWGYEEVGQVIEVGEEVKDIKIGDIIFGTWGHKSTHIIEESFAKDRKLIEGLEPICGIYSHIGAIALNSILDANIHVGETVAIFGQGVPGQIVTQLAKLSGAKVVAVDLDDERLKFSKESGADVVLNPKNDDVPRMIKEITKGRGADVSIEISGSTKALHEAIRATAYSGRVVAAGFFQGEGVGLYLGEEFHHNRINVVCSQISGVSPELTYRWNRLRLNHTIMELQHENKINLKKLITHEFNFSDAKKAFEMLDTRTDCMQMVLKFD